MAKSKPDQTDAREESWRRLRQVRDLLAPLLAPLLALAALGLVVGLFGAIDEYLTGGNGKFLTFQNLRTVTLQMCVVAVAALGMTVIIIAGGIDLSAGTALALCATVLAWGLREDVAFLCLHGENFKGASETLETAHKSLAAAQRAKDTARTDELRLSVDRARETLLAILQAKLDTARQAAESGAPDDALREALNRDVQLVEQKIAKLNDPSFQPKVTFIWLDGVRNSAATSFLAVLMGVATGVAAGLLNGLLISYLRVVPFIVTLGTMTIYLGAGKMLSGNVPIRPGLSQIPDAMAHLISPLSETQWLGFPLGVWLALGLSLVLFLVLRYTVFGRYLFALGSNESTARLCGINVRLVKIAVYSVGGIFIGFAGVYQFSLLTTGSPTSGLGMELKVIAAVVIGGGSLSGGRGTVLGTLTGAALMAVIASGCTQLGLDNSVQDIILGTIIIGAVAIDQLRQGKLS